MQSVADLLFKAKSESTSAPALHDITILEPEPKVESEASAEPVPASIEQDFPTSVEHEPKTTQSDEPGPMTESSSAVALDEDVPISPEMAGGIELLTSAEEIGVDVTSSSEDVSIAVIAHEVEAEVTAETHGTEAPIAAPTTANVVAAESVETEQFVIPATEVFIF